MSGVMGFILKIVPFIISEKQKSILQKYLKKLLKWFVIKLHTKYVKNITCFGIGSQQRIQIAKFFCLLFKFSHLLHNKFCVQIRNRFALSIFVSLVITILTMFWFDEIIIDSVFKEIIFISLNCIKKSFFNIFIQKLMFNDIVDSHLCWSRKTLN